MEYIVEKFDYLLLLAALSVVIYYLLEVAGKIDEKGRSWLMNNFTEHAKSEFIAIRFPLNSSLVSMLSILLLSGCSKKRIVDTDQLISIQYVIGEEIPYSGLSIEKYDSGKIKFEVEYENGLMNGSFIQYYENGNEKQMSECLNGKLNGHYIDYYENGDVSSEGEYINGKKEDMWDWHSEGSKKRIRCNYSNGVKNGTHLFWGDDGTKELTEFVDGEMNGPLTVWHPNGNLKEESYYINWVAHGPFTFYDEAGNISYTGEYNSGEIKSAKSHKWNAIQLD